ncbi:hypothetical protein, conserved [Eimeria maxima]|uniref:Gamma-soluble NSF attachment protein n=1 Tax=Eimeria maxima TaxID=5804 RepID=U6LZ11_EIMMA|nr:hypothetical protein, conserved [Eimeria maxima]CDJ56996.1 hypothetical protein, conserved [Eimeria maxima]
MEVGELHLQRALASLSRSFLFFSLPPDWVAVAREAALAAEAFHAAGLLRREAKALRLCAQAERNLGKPKAAGKAMQKLGDLLIKEKKAARRSSNHTNDGISKTNAGGAAAAAYEEAMQCYGEAICLFRAAGAVEVAVELLLKVAARREHEKTPSAFALCAEAYEEALHLLIIRHDLQQADEVYRHYICSLVRAKELQKALSVVFRRVECLYTLRRFCLSFV